MLISPISRSRLRNVAIAIIVLVQAGLAFYVILSSTYQSKNSATTRVKKSHPYSQRDAIHEVYKNMLLTETRIDASEWDVDANFFRYLLDRKSQDITWFGPSHLADDSAVTYVAKSPIRHLDLRGARITRASLPVINSFVLLRCLEIEGVPLYRSDLEKLLKLKHFIALRSINCGLNDDCLHLIGTHQFDYLQLNKDKGITDVGIAFLKNEPVTNITLNQTSVTNRSALLLSQLPSAITVELEDDLITDQALPYFSQSMRLERLDLRGTHITATGLNHFVPPPSLKELDLSQGFGLTQSTVDEFHKRYPNCRVDLAERPASAKDIRQPVADKS